MSGLSREDWQDLLNNVGEDLTVNGEATKGAHIYVDMFDSVWLAAPVDSKMGDNLLNPTFIDRVEERNVITRDPGES